MPNTSQIRYSYAPNVKHLESTRAITRPQLAQKVFSLLSSEGLLKEGVTVFDVMQCLEFHDKDSFVDIDMEKFGELLIEGDIFDKASMIEFAKDLMISEKIAKLYFSDGTEASKKESIKDSGTSKAIMIRILKTQENYKGINQTHAENDIENIKTAFIGPKLDSGSAQKAFLTIGRKIKVVNPRHEIFKQALGDRNNIEAQGHKIEDAARFMNDLYNNPSDMTDFFGFYKEYFNYYYHHVANDLPGGSDYDVWSVITEETRVSDFSRRVVDGEASVRIDCDTYMQIGSHILNSVIDSEGNKAFKQTSIIMISEDGKSAHAVLIFIEESTGRTFFLNAGNIYEISGENYRDHILGIYKDEYSTFEEYESPEKWHNNDPYCSFSLSDNGKIKETKIRDRQNQ